MASEIVRAWLADPLDGWDPDVELPAQATREQAEIRAATIRSGLERFVREVVPAMLQAYLARDWVALEYASWRDYVREQWGVDQLRLSTEDRQTVARLFRLYGASTRAIGTALNVDHRTVRRDLEGGADAPPEAVTGTDGKTYPAARAVEPSESDPGYVSPERRLEVAAELGPQVPAREADWPQVPAPGGAVESATPAGPTGEAPADEPGEVAYRPWRKFAASSLTKARKELALVTGDYLEAGTVAERADDATIAELEKLATDLADFCRKVRELRAPSSPSGRTPAELATWRRAHAWSSDADEDHSQVWIAAQRKGIEYHRPAEKNLTGCGRSMRTGVVKGIGLAEFHHDAKPCERCWPNGDEESKS